MNAMTLIDKAFFLKKTPLFAELDLDLLLSVADKMQITTFEKDEEIFTDGHEAQRMYFLVAGRVCINDTILAVQDFFGEESLFSEKPRVYSAIAKSHTTLMTLSKTHLMTIISECPSVAIGLLQAYTESIPNRRQS